MELGSEDSGSHGNQTQPGLNAISIIGLRYLSHDTNECAGVRPLEIKASGHGSRQMCLPDKHGFPRTSAKAKRMVHGFRTGDRVKAVVPEGKKKGVYVGKVAVRSSGSFNITTREGTIQGISYKHCQQLQRADGYSINS